MYYEEKWINGSLYFKTMPNADWVAFTIEEYKRRCLKLESEVKEFKKKFDVLKEMINNT